MQTPGQLSRVGPKQDKQPLLHVPVQRAPPGLRPPGKPESGGGGWGGLNKPSVRTFLPDSSHQEKVTCACHRK